MLFCIENTIRHGKNLIFHVFTGARGGTVTVTGTGFGTTKSAVTVTLGGAVQTVSQVTDTAVTVTLVTVIL